MSPAMNFTTSKQGYSNISVNWCVPGRERQEQEYNAYGLGWMCCGYVFGQALAHSQLKRLDSNNALRVQNCNFLTEHLSRIEGIEPPYVP